MGISPYGGVGMARRDLVAALDVGTTKVLALVAEVDKSAQFNLVGVGSSPSRGMRKGAVVDIDSTVRAVGDAVEKAERMCGYSVQSVHLGVAGSHITANNNRAVVAVTSANREIGGEDVNRVLEAVRVINVPPDREIIHVLPRQFIVDGYDGIRDPLGMLGSRLEVEAHIITGSSNTLQNLFRSVEKAGLEVEEAVFSPLAAGDAVLMDDEKELGVALADIGGGTTDVTVYDHGSMVYSTVLPAGGEYITTDVAVGMRTTLAQAELIKIEHGYASPAMIPEERVFPVPGVGGQGIYEGSAKILAEIIEARLREILASLGASLSRSALGRSLPGGVVLTGGVAATRGIVEVAMQELDMPVRTGFPDGVGGLRDMVTAPAYSTGIGLLYYAARKRRPRGGVRLNGRRGGGTGLGVGITDRVRDLFKDFF